MYLADVFTDAEMAAISRDIDEALPRFTPDDGRSWWATTAAGEQRAVPGPDVGGPPGGGRTPVGGRNVPVASALGRGRMREILAKAQARTGIACDTDLEAHIATLHHFGATRIALATRWPDAVNEARRLDRVILSTDSEDIAALGRSLGLDAPFLRFRDARG